VAAGYANDDQGRRDFKKGLLKALKLVLTVYPEANVKSTEHGLVLLPSPPHVLPAVGQGSLF
jgi:hypothetical protein